MQNAEWNEIHKRFSHHPPKDALIAELHAEVREVCLETALALFDMLPPSRERSTAVTKLEEAMFWSNAAIARHMNGN